MDSHDFSPQWNRIKKKWGLPPLRPKDLSHWIYTACRRAGLSKPATAYLQGHDATEGGAMRDWYDNPRLEDIFDEQSSKLPNGPLGLLEPPEVKLVDGLSPAAVKLLRMYLGGQLTTMEFASQMEAIRLQELRSLQV